jgi:hypothetical protein
LFFSCCWNKRGKKKNGKERKRTKKIKQNCEELEFSLYKKRGRDVIGDSTPFGVILINHVFMYKKEWDEWQNSFLTHKMIFGRKFAFCITFINDR